MPEFVLKLSSQGLIEVDPPASPKRSGAPRSSPESPLPAVDALEPSVVRPMLSFGHGPLTRALLQRTPRATLTGACAQVMNWLERHTGTSKHTDSLVGAAFAVNHDGMTDAQNALIVALQATGKYQREQAIIAVQDVSTAAACLATDRHLKKVEDDLGGGRTAQAVTHLNSAMATAHFGGVMAQFDFGTLYEQVVSAARSLTAVAETSQLGAFAQADTPDAGRTRQQLSPVPAGSPSGASARTVGDVLRIPAALLPELPHRDANLASKAENRSGRTTAFNLFRREHKKYIRRKFKEVKRLGLGIGAHKYAFALWDAQPARIRGDYFAVRERIFTNWLEANFSVLPRP